MKNKNKIFIPCDEANHVCDKSQYKEASLWEMVKLNVHLLYCKACRTYSANNSKLTKMMNSSKAVGVSDNAAFRLDDDIKNAFKSDFEKALKEHKD